MYKYNLQTYFNPEALDLIRMLISGGATSELEATLAEGVGMIPGSDLNNVEQTRKRCHVALLPLESGKLEDYSVSMINCLCWYKIGMQKVNFTL